MVKDENKTKKQLVEELKTLRSLLGQIERLKTTEEQSQTALQKRTHDLEERVKELNCLYAISNLREQPGISLEEMLQGTVDLVPSAWLRPEIICARVTVKDRVYKTSNFEETSWKQAADILAEGNRAGTLEVYSLEEKPEWDKGPFSTEERKLINAIAERLGRIIERTGVEEKLRESEEKYSTVVESSLTGIYIEQDGRIVFANNQCAEIYGFSKDDVIGMEACRLIHPEDRALASEIVGKRIRGEDVPAEYEIRGVTKQGETIWVKRRNTRIEYHGEPAVLGNIVEITREKLSEKKERIIETIFEKLGTREGIRLKDVFILIIPELADVMKIQSCALFSISPDRGQVVLEAGYPEKRSYHGLGKTFSIEDEPYFCAIIHQTEVMGEYESEKIRPSYILITDPQRSRLLTENLRQFAAVNNINSILYVPLKTGGVVNYFLSFDALEQHTSFTKDQIELLVFFGKELMKAVRIEQLDDILHDYKNPAIAAAGFARRIRSVLESGQFEANKEKVLRDLEVIARETSRMQEMAFSVYGAGREEDVDMTERLARRLKINREAIREQKRRNIQIIENLKIPLRIRCYPLHLERVFDNLLSNATNAIPEEGGNLLVKSLPMDRWAVAEISNTGVVSDFQREQILGGETTGRGLHIINRLVRTMGGRLALEVGNNQTTFTVFLPRISE